MITALLITALMAVDYIPGDLRTEQQCALWRDSTVAKMAAVRWFTELTLEEFIAAPFKDSTPQWARDMTDQLAREAYAWKGEPQVWVNAEYKACLGKET